MADVNQALKIYLGADASGGYQAVGDAEERLRQAFPTVHVQLRSAIAKYLDEDHVPDWSRRDLSEETAAFRAELTTKFPELDDVAVKALANRWSFGWR